MTSRINLLCSLAYHIYTPSYIKYHRYGNMFIRLFSTVQYVNCSQISVISVQQHRVSLHHITSREHAPQQHISTSHVAHHYQAICTVQWHHSSNQHVARMEFPHYLARTTYKLHTLPLYMCTSGAQLVGQDSGHVSCPALLCCQFFLPPSL